MKVTLEKEYFILECSSGEEALEILNKNNKVDLAIYDIDMPGMGGIEAAEKIWDIYKIPFIICSQFNDENIIDEAIKLGALTYLVKPLNLEELIPSVKTAIERACDIDKYSRAHIKLTELSHTLNTNRRLLGDILHKEEAYRKNLVNTLHDEVGQKNSIIRNTISQIQKITTDPDIVEKCNFANAQLSELYVTIRQIMQKLRPEILDSVLTGHALMHLINTWQMSNADINMIMENVSRTLHLHDPVDIVIYQSLQECLTNISKYADATEVIVEFGETIDGIRLFISDNGNGFETSTTPLGIGLSGIREKTISLGGLFNLKSGPGQGVEIQVLIPLPESSRLK